MSRRFRPLCAALVLVAIASCTWAPALAGKSQPRKKPTMKPPACTRTVTPADAERLQSIVDELPEGAVLCLGAGRYSSRLTLSKPVTLRGAPGGAAEVTIDGGGNGTTVQSWADGGEVHIANLTISGGSAQPSANAGGVYAHGTAKLFLDNVVFGGNSSDLAGAQALLTDAAAVLLTRCRVEGNRGERAAALQADQIGSITLQDSLVAGNEGKRSITARGASKLTVERSTIVAASEATAIDAGGNMTQSPEVHITDSIVVGGTALKNAGASTKATAARSVLSGQIIGLAEGGGNHAGEMHFAEGGTFHPAPGSAALGLARNAEGAVDLAGNPRHSHGAAGAFEAK